MIQNNAYICDQANTYGQKRTDLDYWASISSWLHLDFKTSHETEEFLTLTCEGFGASYLSPVIPLFRERFFGFSFLSVPVIYKA